MTPSVAFQNASKLDKLFASNKVNRSSNKFQHLTPEVSLNLD